MYGFRELFQDLRSELMSSCDRRDLPVLARLETSGPVSPRSAGSVEHLFLVARRRSCRFEPRSGGALLGPPPIFSASRHQLSMICRVIPRRQSAAPIVTDRVHGPTRSVDSDGTGLVELSAGLGWPWRFSIARPQRRRRDGLPAARGPSLDSTWILILGTPISPPLPKAP